jgi:hypothetical protein
LIGGSYGNLCANKPADNTIILTEGLITCNDTNNFDECTLDSDIDEDCKCTNDANTEEACYDDCGLCTGTNASGLTINGLIDSETCTGDAVPGASCTNSNLNPAVFMDCAGVCSNNYGEGTYGATVATFYLDSDGDAWGDATNSSDYCTALIGETAPAETAGYVDNDLDLNDSEYCLANIWDCAGVCNGDAFEDDCGNCSEEWDGSGDVDNGNDVFIAYNEKYGESEGIELAQTPYTDNVGEVCECTGLLTSVLEDYDIIDCGGAGGGNATNYFYYYDDDNDGHLLPYGNLCSGIPEEAGDIVALNLVTCDDTLTEEECTAEADIDDNWSCDGSANTEEGCYDDCGLCNGTDGEGTNINGSIDIDVCQGNSAPAELCTNNNFDPPVSMDCAGVCSNNYGEGTYYAVILTIIYI